MKYFQKYTPIISISLLITLLIGQLFFTSSSRLLSTIILIFGVGTGILFTIHGNWEAKKNDELTNTQLSHNTIVDLLGLALIMLSAMWLGRMAGGYAGQNFGMVAGIVAGIAVGFGTALVIGKAWGQVSDRLRVTT